MDSDRASTLLDELAEQYSELGIRITRVALRLIGEEVRSAHPTAHTVLLWEADGSGLAYSAMRTADGRSLEIDDGTHEEVAQAASWLTEATAETWQALASDESSTYWCFQINALTSIEP